jgi:hypothetical protein
MHKRVTFGGVVLPLLLLTPQLVITFVFFLWPASQALRQSLLKQDPFGLRTTFVWFDNFERVLGDPGYLHSLQVTVVFSITTGMEQIALAMDNINQATVQNLASTSQAEKAAQDLSAVAQQLEGLVARYKLNELN